MRKLISAFCILSFLDLTSAPAQESAQVVLYLEKISLPPAEITLSFEQIELHSAAESFNLLPLATSLRARDLAKRQVLLSEAEVPPGDYRSLHLVISVQIEPLADEDSIRLSYSQEVIVPLDVNLDPGTARTIFLRWVQTVPADTTQPPFSAFHLVRKKMPPLTSQAYVSNEGSGNLSILDLQAGEVVGCLRVGPKPRGLVISRQAGLLYVANSGSNTISVMDVRTQQLRGEITLDFGDEPQALCLSRNERMLFSANQGSNSVTVMDAHRFTILSKISVGTAPLDIAADPAGDWIYVANSLSDDISILNSQTLSLAYTLQAGSFPAAIEFAESQKAAYVANTRSGFITQINSQQIAVSSQLNLSRGISDIAADAFAGTLYCAIESMDYVSVFKPSLNIELTQISTGARPRRVAFDPQGRLLYVCCSGSNEISVINKISGRAERVIAAGQNPFMIVFP